MKKEYAVGIDIGGSHITSALIDMETGDIESASVCTEKVDAKADSEAILSQWAKAVAGSLKGIHPEQLAGIGFAMPGPFDYEKGIALFERVQKYEGLFNINVSRELRNRLDLNDDCPLRYMNDATAFAVGEAWIGKAASAGRSMAITLGTGFGSAFIDQGVPVVEGDDVPPMGCVWHIPYRDGIADDSFSTRWFVSAYLDRTGKKVTGAKEILEAADGDENAAGIFREFYLNLGNFLAPFLKKFGAEVLVIGGNVAESYGNFGRFLTDALAENGLETAVAVSELKENAAIIGSARLLDEAFWLKLAPLVKKM